MSELRPHVCAVLVVNPEPEVNVNQTPVDGRKTVMSAMPSPSKSPALGDGVANTRPVRMPVAPTEFTAEVTGEVRAPVLLFTRNDVRLRLTPFAATRNVASPETVTASVNEPPEPNGDPGTADSVVEAPLPAIGL